MIAIYRAKIAKTLPNGRVDRNYVTVALSARSSDHAREKALEEAHDLHVRTGLEHRVVRVELGS